MKKTEVLIPIAAAIFFFLTKKEILPAPIYLVLALLLSLYFFPGKLVFNNNELRVLIKEKVLYLTSCILVSLLLAGSAVIIYATGIETISTLFKIFSIFNFILAIYYIVTKSKGFEYLVHIGFVIFSAAVSAV